MTGDNSRFNQHRLRDSDDSSYRRVCDKYREGEPGVTDLVVPVPRDRRDRDHGSPASLRNPLCGPRSDLLPGGAVDVRTTNHILALQSQQHHLGHAGD